MEDNLFNLNDNIECKYEAQSKITEPYLIIF